MEEFYTVKENIETEIIEKKSRFIANIFYIESIDEAENIIKSIKKKHYNARHNCYAYRIIQNGKIIDRFSDDGEPSSTAGAPILNILVKKNLVNVLIVVTRYFGGILLGTGGLVRAYSQAANNVIEMSKIIDLASEGKTFIRQIVRENGQKAWLRIYNDMMRFPSEREITAAFKRMVMELPKVGILQGHGERSIRNLKDVSYSLFANDKKFRYALMNQGFDIEEVVLDKAVPESIKILVIADMRESLKPEEEMNLQQYINRGGNLFILGEPRRREKMNPLFAKFGFELMPGVLVKQDTNRQADMLLSYPTKEARSIAYEFGSLYDYAYVITTPSVAGLRQLEDRGFEVTELFKSDTVGSWNELETTDFIDDTISLNPLIGEVERSYPTIVALSRKVGDKEQKIILAGDADCISNGEFSRGGIRASNYTLITAGFFWLSDNEVPIDIRRPEFPDNKLYMGPVGERITKILFLYVLPCLLFGIGIFVWIRRKGR